MVSGDWIGEGERRGPVLDDDEGAGGGEEVVGGWEGWDQWTEVKSAEPEAEGVGEESREDGAIVQDEL